jgi:hypothetical protein
MGMQSLQHQSNQKQEIIKMKLTIEYDKKTELSKEHHLYGLTLLSNKGQAIGYINNELLKED